VRLVLIEGSPGGYPNAVDEIEDTKSRELNKAQQLSTNWPHLAETKGIENRGVP
jgi:hypothetical protein